MFKILRWGLLEVLIDGLGHLARVRVGLRTDIGRDALHWTEDLPNLNIYSMKNQYLLFGILMLLCFRANSDNPRIVSLLSQQVVSGRVADESNTPIPGVNVLIKGSSTGTVTDAEGKFTIDAGAESVLVFSFIGYKTQEVSLTGRTTVDVVMAADVQSLDEVVVTALGIKKSEKSIGYAASVVKGEDLAVNRSSNFMNSLQGKVAGVNISSKGTGPGGTSKIRHRAQSSVGGQNNPLIVINGVPVESGNYGVNAGSSDSQNRGPSTKNFNKSDGGDGLLSINPDDIESMTVLKGGTAAALYGSRAKDGVIMITTKSRGAGRGIGVEWNSNFMSSKPLDFTDFQYKYGQGYQKILNSPGVGPTAGFQDSGVWSFGEKFEPGQTQITMGNVEAPYKPVRNRIDKFFRTGQSWSNTISLSSGSDKGGFNLSLSKMNSTGIVPKNSFERKTVNLGFTQEISKNLKVTGNINYSNEYNKNPPVIGEQDIGILNSIYTMSNSLPLSILKKYSEDANGNETYWSNFRNRTNPYFVLDNRFENIRTDRLFGNLTVRYNIKDWLFVQGRLGQDFYSRDQDYNFPTGLQGGDAVGAPGFVNGYYVQETRRFREVNADFLVGANRKFGDFGIDLSFGGNQMYRRQDLNSVLVQDFAVRGLYTVMNGRAKDPQYSLSEKQINSLYGVGELSYKNYLFLNLTARNDWFSTLSPAQRSIMYPSVTGSFVFSDAFEGLPSWLTFGKVRAAYARVGSDLDVAPYANNLFYGLNPNFFNSQIVASISATGIPNPNLKPMVIDEVEFGVAAKLFQDRVSFDLAYYVKTTSNQILDAQVSDASGYLTRKINVGESRNKGIEFLVSGAPVATENFRWDISFNGSYNTSEVLSLGAASTTGSITVGSGIYDGQVRQVVGKPIGQLYGYGYMRDAEGRQVFNASSGYPVRSTDYMNFGSAIPKWVGGINNSFNYKGVLFSFLIDFKLGHKMISQTNYNLYRHGLHKATLPGREEGYVIGKGVNVLGDGTVQENTTHAIVQTYYEQIRASRIVEDFVYNAGYWKLRQVSIGYDFTKFLPQNLFIKSVRLSAVANNVLMIKKWVPNIDPESFGFASDNLVGLEATGMPTTRNIGFNLNVKF